MSKEEHERVPAAIISHSDNLLRVIEEGLKPKEVPVEDLDELWEVVSKYRLNTGLLIEHGKFYEITSDADNPMTDIFGARLKGVVCFDIIESEPGAEKVLGRFYSSPENNFLIKMNPDMAFKLADDQSFPNSNNDQK